MKTLNALTVRKKFGSIIDEVWKDKVRIAVSRANKPLVVLIPYDEYESEYNIIDRKRKLQAVSKKIDIWRQRHKEHFDKFNSTDIIRKMRESNCK